MPQRAGRAVLLIAVAMFAAACSKERDPIAIEGNTLTVENQTKQDWRNVMVTVNDHFRGGAPKLSAGSRLTAPLTQFQTAYGQRFSLERQVVFKVEVAATDAAGQPVSFRWGNDKKR